MSDPPAMSDPPTGPPPESQPPESPPPESPPPETHPPAGPPLGAPPLSEAELSRARLAAFFDQSAYYVGVIDLEGRLTEVNEPAMALLEAPAETQLGRPFWETDWWAGHRGTMRRIREGFAAVLTGEVYRARLPYRTAAGERRHTELVMKRIDGRGGPHDGRPLFVVAQGRDVTDQVRGEQRLGDALSRMRLASEAADFGTFEYDVPRGRFWASPELRSLLNLGEGPSTLADLEALVDARDVPAVSEAVAESLRTEGQRSFEREFRMKPPRGAGEWPSLIGTSRWMLVRGRTVLEEGRVRAVTGAVLDVTARRRSERRLAETQQLNLLALQAAGMGTWVADATTGAVRRDATLNQLLGMPAVGTEATVEETLALVHEADRDRVRRGLRDAVLGRGPLELRFRVRTPGGEVRYARADGLPVDEGQRMGRWIGALTDETEDREVEQRLQAAAEVAEAANRTKSEFIANMSHEIRTPMTSILGYADLLLDGEEDASRAAHLQTIRRNGELLLALINDILDLSKIEAGRMEVEPVRTDLRELIDDVRGMVEVRAREKGLAFVEEYGEEVPQYVCTDAMRVRQVLINLLGNAVKFTREGTVTLRVSRADRPRLDPSAENVAKANAEESRDAASEGGGPAGGPPRADERFEASEEHREECDDPSDPECREDNEGDAPHVRFEVIDTGVGIDEGQQKRLFVPFAQADASVSRDFGGTGLGLAICQRLAAILGGCVEFESALGEGSRFSLVVPTDLPVEEPHLSCGGAGPADLSEAPMPTGPLAARVMVVDDQPDIRFLTTAILEGQGVRVETAVDGLAAVARLAEGKDPPDLVLLDMQMPKLSGYDTARMLREGGFDRPIVALTADAMHGDMTKCLESGCDAYLPKPIDSAELLAAVRKWVGGR